MIEWIDNEEDFAALEAEWDALADIARNTFLRHAWVRAWWGAFGQGWGLRLCTLRDGDGLAAVVPLCRRSGRLRALAGLQSPDFAPLARNGEALRAIAEAVYGARWDELVLPSLPPAALDRLTSLRGGPMLVEPQHASPVVEITTSFDEYVEGLDRHFRSEVRRRRRKLEGEHETVFRLCEPPADLLAETEEAFRLEAAGWKGAAGGAVLSSPPMTAFYRSMCRAFHERGRLVLSTLRCDGRLAAFNLSLLDYDRLWTLKGAYDESLRRYGPSLMLKLAEIEECFGRGLEACEILGEREEWKERLATSERPHSMLRVYRRRPVPLARFAYRRFLRPQLRRAVRRVRRV